MKRELKEEFIIPVDAIKGLIAKVIPMKRELKDEAQLQRYSCRCHIAKVIPMKRELKALLNSLF